MIIGMVGLAQTGKSTTAEILSRRFGFKEISFAAPLKKIAYDIDPLVTGDKHYAELVDEFGLDYVKTTYPEARRFLQRLGTEGIRQNIDDDFWINLALTIMGQEPESNFVISDMRFLNEYYKIKRAYGDQFESWGVERDGAVLMNHASEVEMASIPKDRVLDNNGTIADLENLVVGIAESMGMPQLSLR